MDAFKPPQGVEPLDIHLQKGQALYLPAGWWHAVQGSQEPNLAVVFGYAPSELKGDRYFGRQPQRPEKIVHRLARSGARSSTPT